MTKKNRFNLLPDPEPTAEVASAPVPLGGPQTGGDATVPTREAESTSQLNVRINTKLKRRAVAKAALEGKSMVDLIEKFLEEYVGGDIAS